MFNARQHFQMLSEPEFAALLAAAARHYDYIWSMHYDSMKPSLRKVARKSAKMSKALADAVHFMDKEMLPGH